MSESNSKVYIAGSFAAIGGFLFGYHTAVISGVATMSDFISTFGGADSVRQGKLTSVVNGGIVASLLSGCVFGSLIAGRVSDILSRKRSIVISSIIFIISGVLQVFSVNLAMLIVARFIAGKF
jgi:SP family sugar:H+ symporter-like MFS transporter